MLYAYMDWVLRAMPVAWAILTLCLLTGIGLFWNRMQPEDAIQGAVFGSAAMPLLWMVAALFGPPLAAIFGWILVVRGVVRLIRGPAPKPLPPPDEYAMRARKEVECIAPEETV